MPKHTFKPCRANKAHVCNAWKGTEAQWNDWAGRRDGQCRAPITKGDKYFVVTVKGLGSFRVCQTCGAEKRLVYPDIPMTAA